MKKETKQIVESDEYDPHGYKELSNVATSILSEDYDQYKKLEQKNITEAVDEDHVSQIVSGLDVEDRKALKRVYNDIQSDIIPQNRVVRAVANVLRVAGVPPMDILDVVDFITSDPSGFEDVLVGAEDSAPDYDYTKDIEDVDEVEPISDKAVKKMDPDLAERTFEEGGPKDKELEDIAEFEDADDSDKDEDSDEDEDDINSSEVSKEQDDDAERPEDYYDEIEDMSDADDLPNYER